MNYYLFKQKHLELIALNYDVREIETGKRFVIYRTSVGNVTYYPDSNRLQIHEGNNWLSNGFFELQKIIRIHE